jgi:peptide/nickel transport system substrate-binding protein
MMKERVEAGDARPRMSVLSRKLWPDFIFTRAPPEPADRTEEIPEKVGDEGFGADWRRSLYPCRLLGVEIVLRPFDQYWRKTPKVKRLVFKVISDESTRLAAQNR